MSKRKHHPAAPGSVEFTRRQTALQRQVFYRSQTERNRLESGKVHVLMENGKPCDKWVDPWAERTA